MVLNRQSIYHQSADHNFKRSHQSLCYATPMDFLSQMKGDKVLPVKC